MSGHSNYVEIPVQKGYGLVELKPHQIQRNERRGGRTNAAAARLAEYRLRRWARSEQMLIVGDVEISANDDLVHDRRQVAALARCIYWARSGPAPDIRLPPGLAVLRVPLSA